MRRVSSRYIFQVISVAIFGAVLYGCSESEVVREREVRIGKGEIAYGGLLKMNISSETRSIFPHNIIDASAVNLMSQVYEGLMKLNNETEKIETALAENFEISNDGTKYTFKLRKGIFFHDDQIFPEGIGREVKAEDVVFCLKKLCSPSDYNEHYALVLDIIKGARAYYESGGDEASPIGIKALDDYTLEIELEYTTPTFLSILTHPACWVFPNEIYDYKNQMDSWCVGTGPFVPRTVKINEVVIFERNEKYWRSDELGNRLPYLDAVRCNFVTDENKQLDYFLDGHLDLLLEVPYSRVAGLENAIAQSDNPMYQIFSTPGLRVEYYGFQHRAEYFNDINVRKAFYQAIDRNFLVDSILFGYGVPADFGFIPPTMPGYQADSVHSLEFNPTVAREFLAAAGYPGGNGFPVLSLQLNDGSISVLNVATAVQHMLIENLGITIELSVLNRDSHYETVENGTVSFWRDGWIGDYPDPENFLQLFHGKLVPEDSEKASYMNSGRFKNDEFDAYFESALKETDSAKRNEAYYKADQIIIDQAAVVPLYYEKWIWLVKSDVKNLGSSGIGNLDLSTVHFSKEGLAN